MRNFIILFFGLIFYVNLFAQDDKRILDYIFIYRNLAIAEMQRTGVPAAIKLAQGIHETNAGTSKLVLKSNNHFGIKCKDDWKGKIFRHTDDAPNECFRKYDSPIDSYKDHSDFLKSRPWYASLFFLDPLDYENWAYGLKKAGYATNPKYPQILIKLIENYNLQDYSLTALEQFHGSVEGLENKSVQLIAADFPENDFLINNTKVVFARKGVSYLFLATKYEVELAKLFEFNEMTTQEFVEEDQLIYLQRKRKIGNNKEHVVKFGETLFSIAQIEAIRLESLL